MLRAVIFDCDGVLFHSERANIAFFDTVLIGLGLPPLDEQGRHMARSMAGSQLVQALFGDDASLIARARAAAQALDYDPFYRWMDPVPRLYETLALLKADYRLAMATNRGVTVSEVMRRFRLSDYFELAVGVLDVERPKPAPDMLVKCITELGIAPDEGLYVGDAAVDYAAAHAAGLDFVGIGAHTGAAVTLPGLEDLPALLSGR